MAKFNGNTVSYNGGKFKLAGTYSYSDGAFNFTPELKIVDNKKFNKKQTYYVEWSADGTNWEKSGGTSATHNGDYTFKNRTLNGTTLYVRIKVGSSSYSKSGEVTSGVTPTPTSIRADKLNDSCVRITVTGEHSKGYPVSKVKFEKSTDGANWSDIAEISISSNTGSYSASYDDTDVEPGGKYYYRAKAYNSVKSYSDPLEYDEPVYTSASSSAVPSVATSQTGNTVTVTWTCDLAAIQKGSVTEFIVMRSANGGTFARVGTVDAVAGQASYSYRDTVASGSTYEYRVDVSGSGGQSQGGTTGGGEIETAPNAPSSVSVYRNGSDDVVINISGSSSNADNVVIERSIDGGNWTQIASESYPLTTYTDENVIASDSIEYRVRYTNSSGESGWAYSGAVQIKQKPEKPFLKSPVNGSPIDMDAGVVRLIWQHRPLDGTPQTAAQIYIELYRDGEECESGSIYLDDETYYDLDISELLPNDKIYWAVRTKGCWSAGTSDPEDDYSGWSDYSEFTLLKKPSLAFTEPHNADVISELPVIIEFSYNDQCGTLRQLQVDIIKNHEVVKTIEVDVGSGTSGTYTYNLKGFLFDNETVYGLKAYALSSSGLTDETSISISIQYDDVSIPGGLLPMVVSDPETGYTYVTCLRDKTEDEHGVVPEPVAIAEAYLYRVHDFETVLVSSVYEGLQILDKYAPINVDYDYKLLLMTEDGEVSIVTITVRNNSPYWFCYFGDEIAKAKWNPEGEANYDRPERKEVRYSGRRYPVSYDQDAADETFNFSTVLLEREELNLFKKLMRKGGTGIWKSGDGDVYDANFKFKHRSDFKGPQRRWNASLSVTRIDGEGGKQWL